MMAECKNQSRITDDVFLVGAWFWGRRIDHSRVWIGECPVVPLPDFIADANVRHWDLLAIALLLVRQFRILLPAQLGERKIGQPACYYLQVGMPHVPINPMADGSESEVVTAVTTLICDYGTPMDGSPWLFFDGHNRENYLFHRRPVWEKQLDTYTESE
jgi:hypothetical protein